ncbi:hypothetical protein T484DRAFT_2960714 [Baffinella frigidus]|nr:hypothetical protein T484DRAFT_2960714 [Cryptophyta sp. CCMP2293]
MPKKGGKIKAAFPPSPPAAKRGPEQDQVVEIQDSPQGKEPAAKRSRQAAGGAAASMQEMVAEVVQIKKEKLDEALKRQAEDAATIRSKADEANELRERLAKLSQEAECPICLDNVADMTLACGHCFCCAADCGSSQMQACPSCGGPTAIKTKLFGVVGSLEALLSRVDAGQPAPESEQLPGDGGGAGPVNEAHPRKDADAEDARGGGPAAPVEDPAMPAQPEALPAQKEGDGHEKPLSVALVPHALEHRRFLSAVHRSPLALYTRSPVVASPKTLHPNP